ncbi:MAG TPA: RNA polymerase sigma factor [Capillimicrobium sp.]|nr:RNA polymerase sigma factor [Capillimicrobium sp.]
MEAGALQAPAGLSRISIAAPLLRLRSDEQLVALFRAGNDEAFQVIFDRYRQRLFAYARQMLGGSRQDAEDALQDVFLRAYAALRANDRPVSLRAWLYRVAHNRCIDQLRRPVPAHADVFDLSRAPLRDPIEESQRREDLRRLVEDVQRLPQAQRSALLMREMDGLSYQELADALDVTVPAVKSLLVRARIGLVEAIEARDTACADIRNDLMASYDRGVRASGKARRHLRDCAGCRAYRTELRAVQRGLSALTPSSGPFGLAAKVLGIGGGAGGAAAGGGAVLGGGAAVVGGSAATATACKVAAIVCSAALVTGAAGNLESTVKRYVGSLPAAIGGQPGTAERSPAGASAPSSTAAKGGATLARSPLERLTAAPAAKAAPAAGAAQTRAERRRARARSGDVLASAAAGAAEHQARPLTPDGEVYLPAAGASASTGATAPTAGNVTGGAVAPPEEPAPAVAPPLPSTAPAPAATTAPAPPQATPAPAPTGGGTATTGTGASATTATAPAPSGLAAAATSDGAAAAAATGAAAPPASR